MQVKRFQEAVSAPMPVVPTLLPKERFTLRHKLLQEEVDELQEGYENESMIQVADACGDILYILLGTVLEFGFADRFIKIFDEIQSSNMSKVDPETGKVIYREDGKVMKPEHYRKPNLELIMARDFSIYKLKEQEAKEVEQEIWNDFNKKIEDAISKSLHQRDARLYDTFLEMQRELSKIINVSVKSDGLSHKAVITLYGSQEIMVTE